MKAVHEDFNFFPLFKDRMKSESNSRGGTAVEDTRVEYEKIEWRSDQTEDDEKMD